MKTGEGSHARHARHLPFRRLWLCALLVSLAEGQPAQRQAPTPPRVSLPLLTRAEQVRHLTPEQAKRGYPVRLRAVVTYFDDSQEKDLFLQDSSAGVWVDLGATKLSLRPGQSVELEGVSDFKDFAPQIAQPRVRILREGQMPAARRVSFEDMVSTREDSQWVEVEGVIHSASSVQGYLSLAAAMGSGRLRVRIPNFWRPVPPRLVDARVRVRGACGAEFNQKGQLIGVMLYVPSLGYVEVVERPPVDPFNLPVRSIGSLLRFAPGASFGHRVRVQGVVTLARQGRSLFVEDKGNSANVQTVQRVSVQPGDQVDVLGFPAVGQETPILLDAVLRTVGHEMPPPPLRVTATEALQGAVACDGHLVRLEARLLDSVLTPAEQLLLLQSGDQLFNAQLEDPAAVKKFSVLAAGSWVEVTGICSVQLDENRQPRAFRILLRSAADVVVLQRPPWWTLRHTLWTVGAMAALILAALAWATMLRRRVAAQTRDIREWLKREAALKARYRELFENAHDIVLTCDLQGNFTSFNRAAERITGYARSEALGMQIAQIVAPECATLLRRMLDPEVQTPQAETYQLEMLAKNGQRVPVEVSARIIREEGKPLGVQMIARDITARKRAEEALRASEERYRAFVAMASEGIWRFEGDQPVSTALPEDQQIEQFFARAYVAECNDANARMYGFNRAEEFIGTRLETLLRSDPRNLDLLRAFIRSGYRLEDVESFEKDRDGGLHHFLNSLFGVVEDGKLVRVWGVQRDITERKRAEEARAFLASIVRSSEDAIVGHTLDGRIASWNRGAEVLYGYRAEEVIGKPVSMLVSAEHVEGWQQLAARANQGESISNVQGAAIKKDGSRAHISLSISPIRGAGGQVTASAAIIRDMTGCRQAEQRLRESEAKYRTLLENLPQKVFHKNENSAYVACNENYARDLGIEPQEITGKTDYDFYPRELAEKYRADDARILRSGRIEEFDEGYIQGGERRIVHTVKVPLGDDQGTPPGILGIFWDITEKKRVEEALQKANEMVRAVIRASPLAILTLDPEGIVRMWNPSAERMFGWREDEALGRPLPIVPEENQEESNALRGRLMRGESAYGAELRRKKKDGSWIDVSLCSAALRDASGQTVGLVEVLTDITEKKRAEEALRQAEQKYRSIFENAVEGIFQSTPDGRHTSVNPALARMYGYESPEQLMKSMTNIERQLYVEPQRRALLRDQLENQGEVRGFESQVYRKDGSVIWISENVHVVRDKSGKLVCYEGTVEDITERKRTQEALQERTTYLSALIENNSLAIAAHDSQGRITMCNPAFQRLFQYRQEEILGAQLDDLVVPAELLPEAREYTRRVRAGEALQATPRRCRKDGTLIDVELHCVPLSVDGKLVGAYVLYQDITERKRAEKALQERTTYLSALIENSPLAIVAHDSQGRVEMCNPAFERLFQYRQEEILGAQLDDLVVPAELLSEGNEFTRRVVAGETFRVITRRCRKDGSLMDVELHCVPLSVGGKLVGAYGLYQDITERKRAAQTLQQAKEAAEAASRAKSEFLANMSHEIRTPLNGILGMTELALDTDLAPEQREYLTMVQESAESLLMVINDILDFSKIEAGKLALDFIDFTLRDCLGNTMKALAVRAHQKGLELAFRVPPEVPEELLGDPTRLRQIVLNLVGNAIKFTEQGEVILRVELQSRTEKEAQLLFAVTDTGIGIAAEKQRMVFEAFAQVDGSTTRKYGGTGLGLAISAQLVEAMGGRIWLESEPGKGSSFYFTGRFGLGKAAPACAVPRPAVNLRGMPVLVVDDNATNLRILEEILVHWQMKPALANGGWTALAAMGRALDADKPFPLVLIDAQMPDMDGFALAERIRQNPRLAGATIMMLTSAGRPGDAARCRELGIAAYLVKPIKQSELLDAILTALSKPAGKALRPALVTRHSLREARRKLRILLAEDNPVSQELASRLLQRWGHVVVAVRSGREALAALEKSPDGEFDAVLMDVQMPDMDGLEATAAIRTKEKTTGKHLPIVALTAHAMKGDRERCLGAGMDGYLSKPIRAKQLFEALEDLIPISPPAELVAPAAAHEVLDRTQLLARVEGDTQLLAELTGLFLADSPKLLSAVKQAVASRDGKALERAAHKLKGSVGNFAAQSALAAAQRLESMGRRGDLADAEEGYVALEKEIERLKTALADLGRKAAL